MAYCGYTDIRHVVSAACFLQLEGHFDRFNGAQGQVSAHCGIRTNSDWEAEDLRGVLIGDEWSHNSDPVTSRNISREGTIRVTFNVVP